MPYQGRLPYTYKSPYNYTLDQGTQTVPSLAFLGDTNNGLFSPATDNVAITTNGTEKLRVTSAGNVGIGTTIPVAPLDIASSIYQSVRTYLPSITDSYHLYRGTPDGLGYEHTRVFSGRDSTTYSYGSYLAFYTEGKNSGTTDTSIERLRINSLGNVGIGTTNPTEKLHVYSSGAVASVNIDSSNSGSTVYYCLNGVRQYTTEYVPASNFYSIGRSGVAYDFNLKNGNVGIGTTNPEDRLDLASGFIRFKEAIGGTGTYGGIRAYNSLVPSVSATAIRFIRDVAEVGNDGAICFDTTNNERLRITSTGNVGIGTTNPGTKLDVDGAITSRLTGASGGFRLHTNSGIVAADNVVRFFTGQTYGFNFNSNATGDSTSPLMSITLAGNVGIGTTNPSEKLEVTGKVRIFDGGYPYIDIGITTSNYFRIIHDNPNDRLFIGKNNNASLVITGGNNVEPGADATQNLGSSTKRWANIYSADIQLSNEGSQNDVDGTWGQYTIQEGENDLFLLNRRNGKKYKFVLQEVN